MAYTSRAVGVARSRALHMKRTVLAVLLIGGMSLLGSAAVGASMNRQLGLHDPGGYPVSGQITSVGSLTFTVEAEGGMLVTVNTTTTTPYTEGTATVTAAALAVGENVQVRGTISTTTPPITISATSVHIDLVTLTGFVQTPGTTSVVIIDGQGFERTIVLGTTKYSEGPFHLNTTVTAADLTAGVEIEASGVVDANHTSLDASLVHIVLNRVEGSVTGITGSDVTLALGWGPKTVTVVTTMSTVYFNSGGVATSSIVVMNADLEALGAYQSDGTFLADFVGVSSDHHFPSPPAHGHHKGGLLDGNSHKGRH